MAEKKVLMSIRNLKQYFPVGKKSMGKEQLYVRANDGISMDIYEGETFGLVGESGCGKSTLGRTILQLYTQTAGRTVYYGRTVDEMAPKYAEEIYTKLSAKVHESKELTKKAKEMRDKYEAMPDGSEKNIFLGKVIEEEKQASNLLLNITSLIGGLYVADDLAPASAILVEKYKASLERNKAVQQKANPKNKRPVSELDATIARCESKMKEQDQKIAELKKKYASKPDFDFYEKQVDEGIDLASLTSDEMRLLRRDLQLIFQDPYSSLNPRMTVGQIIGEGVVAHGIYDKKDKDLQQYIMDTMQKCGLAPYFIHRYPHQFSGGQRQRIGIARSLAVKPKFVVCDEAVSALDVSIQSQIINLLLDLKEQDNLTYLFISHDLSVIKYISDRIGVMYLGNMMELSDTDGLFSHPYHPYTEALLSAIPTTDLDDKKEHIILEGDIPSPIRPPKGCKFNTRCKYCTDICREVAPELEEVEPGHFVACHHKL